MIYVMEKQSKAEDREDHLLYVCDLFCDVFELIIY